MANMVLVNGQLRTAVAIACALVPDERKRGIVILLKVHQSMWRLDNANKETQPIRCYIVW